MAEKRFRLLLWYYGGWGDFSFHTDNIGIGKIWISAAQFFIDLILLADFYFLFEASTNGSLQFLMKIESMFGLGCRDQVGSILSLCCIWGGLDLTKLTQSVRT